MKQHKIRFSLATAVFLAGASAAFAQTAAVPAANSMSATAKPPMTAAQIAFKHHKLPKSFSTEVAAKDHCKTPVIWAETNTRVYYPQASAGFGTARPGVYACVKDAIKAGYRKGAA